MQVTFQLTPEDYRHGLLARRNFRTSTRWFIRGAWLVVCLLLLISIAQLTANPISVALGTVTPAIIIAVCWTVFLLWGPGLSARRQFKNSPSAQGPTTIEVSESGLHLQSSNVDSNVAWSAYFGWTEDKSVFVLMPQPRICFPIPKRAFSSEQIEHFRDILRRNIGKK